MCILYCKIYSANVIFNDINDMRYYMSYFMCLYYNICVFMRGISTSRVELVRGLGWTCNSDSQLMSYLTIKSHAGLLI